MKLSSVEKQNIHYPPITFNKLPVKRVQSHKHLGLALDSKLNFNEHISSILSIVNKLTAVLRNLQTVLPKHSLSTIYKAFIRPHLDYCDVIYDKIFNESWHKKLESAQYNAALAITGAIRGTNTVKFYQELELDSLQKRHKLRRLSLFYKIYNDQSPLYLYNLIPAKTSGNYPLRNVKGIPTVKAKHRFFENSFFPATLSEWNDLDYSLRNAPSINVFKQNILKFIRLSPNKVFNIYIPHGLKLLTRLRLGLSHLRGQKFNHNFSDCLDEICMCRKDIESTNHFFFQPPY